MGFRALRLIDVLEAAYGAVERGPEAWLEGVLESVRPGFDQGLGVQGYFVDASRPDAFETHAFTCVGTDRATVASAFARWDRDVPAAFKRRLHTFAPFGVGSALPTDIAGEPRAQSLETHGFPEVLGVNGLDATLRGCVVAATSPRAIPLPDARIAALWGRVAVHLATAARLRRKLDPARPSEAAEAVLDPDGRVVDAVGPAREIEARASLRAAARAVDRARTGAARADDEEATRLWQALVGRRWSLIDDFESDGRRYVLAVPNRPHLAASGALSAREREVLGALALGHSNKLIAYELGLSTSSVATHIARAGKKLGAVGRVELVRLVAVNPGLVAEDAAR